MRPTRATRTDTLLSNTPLFRSIAGAEEEGDYEFVERDGEGDEQSGEDAGRDDRQGDPEEGRRRPRAEIERGLLQAAVESLEAGTQHGNGEGHRHQNVDRKSTRLNSSH